MSADKQAAAASSARKPIRAFLVVEIRGQRKSVESYAEALQTAIEGDVMFLDLIWKTRGGKTPTAIIHDIKIEEESVQA